MQFRLSDFGSQHDQKQGELASLEDQIAAGEAEMKGLEEAHQGQLKDLEDKYQGLQDAYAANQDEVAKLQGELGGAKADLAQAAENLGKAEADLAATTDELQKALELAKDRQDVAQRIKEDFERAGIKAEVDSGTGDVIIDFGKDYFDTDSHQLKPGMEQKIRKAMPVYANSLFSSETRIAEISAVEIIGFASPTYGGKPVNPQSLSAQNRRAVNYNLDLSYERARSIFHYAFDTNTLKFKYQ